MRAEKILGGSVSLKIWKTEATRQPKKAASQMIEHEHAGVDWGKTV